MITNFELEELAQKHKVPLNAVVCKDQLPPTPRPGGYIVNMQDSTEGNGTHWVCVYIENKHALYFDSFGCLPPIEIVNFLKPFQPYLYNKKDIQNIRSSICGYYCFYVLWFISRHKQVPFKQRYESMLMQFSKDPEENKRILQKLLPVNIR